jgi:DNA-binding PadR family transcriptional regulator
VSVRLSLLALLAQGSSYGYQLRSELDWRTGGAGPINVGQIYNTLDRLERDKLVRKTGIGNFYEITDAGRAAVAQWFSSSSPVSELAAKLALAATLPGVDVDAIVRTQRAALPVPRNNSAPSSSAELAAEIVAASVRAAAESGRELLDATERLLASGIPRTPLSDEVPRRGRPAKPVA